MKKGFSINEMEIGQEASFSKTITEADVSLYAGVTGDLNPAHINEEYAKKTIFKGRIAHGMLGSGFISAVLGTKLPGPGTIYISQKVKFTAPVKIGDTVTATVRVKNKNEEKNRVIMDTICTTQEGKEVIVGEAVLMPPKK
ncbi:MaoC family dehydratase [Halanaerobium praevalens]|uniref:MaoC domain protein dehydratase n=1 Tax=Halanaerobium praevalens (strain ATCC 33744 / DSM 2228 / GSL) TaxID=572479 RepID=E3DM08_HALPG|nr:MaoC family dehydratase [Halanaerobium praevalens]ADO76267.1 MaoC domain protein dehydratase [Halanaerobium praevalens DSM 2228]